MLLQRYAATAMAALDMNHNAPGHALSVARAGCGLLVEIWAVKSETHY